jgi:hypothetical protein
VVVGEIQRQPFREGEQAGRFLRQVRRAAIGSPHDQGELVQCSIILKTSIDCERSRLKSGRLWFLGRHEESPDG